MDVPYALQAYLASDAGVQGNSIANGVFLLELPESLDAIMPQNCVVVQGAGGSAHYGSATLQLNDQRIVTKCFGQDMHLAWNLDSVVYHALKSLTPSVWAETFLHWAKPQLRAHALRDPDTQWPYVLSSWQVLASDLTIAA